MQLTMHMCVHQCKCDRTYVYVSVHTTYMYTHGHIHTHMHTYTHAHRHMHQMLTYPLLYVFAYHPSCHMKFILWCIIVANEPEAVIHWLPVATIIDKEEEKFYSHLEIIVLIPPVNM